MLYHEYPPLNGWNSNSQMMGGTPMRPNLMNHNQMTDASISNVVSGILLGGFQINQRIGNGYIRSSRCNMNQMGMRMGMNNMNNMNNISMNVNYMKNTYNIPNRINPMRSSTCNNMNNINMNSNQMDMDICIGMAVNTMNNAGE
eukprot:45216_1